MSIERVNERELLSAAMQGSQVAYRELIHLHQGSVYRFAWAMIGEEDAQRVTEHVFLTAWRQLDYLKSMHLSLRERLLQLVCIECADASKHRHRRRIALPSAMSDEAINFPAPPLRYDPRTNMEHLALQTDIEDALQALPLRFRQILLLHEMGDLADTQIADLLGDDAQTVHADLLRARGFVRRHILQNGGFFPPTDAPAAKKSEEVKYQACADKLPTLSAAADDLCTNAEKQILSAHLAQCPGCQAYYDSLRSIHHGITVMKHEVPGDIASYVIHRIQQEDGKGDFAAPGEKAERRRFRPAFGRFTVIGLCLALVLLAYSNGIMDHFRGDDTPAPNTPDQSQTTQDPKQDTDPAPAPDEAETPTPEEPTAPDVPAEDPPAENGGGSGDDNSAIVPGGGASSTLIPDGEVYAGIYTVGNGGDAVLVQYCTVSFRATLTDGTDVSYYVVPAEQSSDLNAALQEGGISCTPYDDAAIDENASQILYLMYR